MEGAVLEALPTALLTDGDRPIRLRVALLASSALLDLLPRLRPLFWSTVLGREVRPLELSEVQAVPTETTAAWDVALSGQDLLPNSSLEVVLGLMSPEGTLQQTLPLGSLLPVVANPDLWFEITANDSVVPDLCALMDAAAAGGLLPAPRAFLGIAEGLAEYARETKLPLLEGRG